MLSSVISSINLDSALPSFLEVIVASHIEEGLYSFFKYGHSLLGERSSLAAGSLIYSNEIFLVMMGLLERQMLWSCDAGFSEVVMGLRRAAVAEKSVEAYRKLIGQIHIPPALFGPPPSVSAEERALMRSSLLPDNVKFPKGDRVSGAASGSTVMPNINAATPGAAPEVMNASQVMKADKSLYGHLRFKKLSVLQRMVSLFLLVGMPYLKRRLAVWYEQQVDSSPDAAAARESYKRDHPRTAEFYALMAKYVYPVYHVTFESFNFLFEFFYMLELTPYTSPLHRLFRIALKRSESSDSVGSSKGTSRALLAARVMLLLFYYGTLLVQFTTRHFNHHQTEISSGSVDMPIPSPPQFSVDTGRPSFPVVAGVCPVCHSSINNCSVLTVSGVLGCYVCLHEYTTEHKRCPVTLQPASVQQIRRVVHDS